MSKLYIVPTPIGNLKDISLRSLEILKQVDVILAEDTRTTGKLLKNYDIKKPLKSYHKFNEHKVLELISEQISGGQLFALVSDSGTPGISDPGFLLIRECLQKDIEIECLPGATAFVPALINSGLSSDRFSFEGFLPPKKGRKKRLEELISKKNTFILYESPHRLLKSLNNLIEHLGADRNCCVSKELTKLYEENIRGSLQEVYQEFSARNIKGEYVIVVEGNQDKKKQNYTYEYPRPAFSVDAIIIKDNQVLLIQRKNEPFIGMWALPGGFVDMDETIEKAVSRELFEETGLKKLELIQFHTFSAIGRDPRHRTISTIFYAIMKDRQTPIAGDDAAEVKWFSFDKLPQLAFDHNDVLERFKLDIR